EESLVDVQGSRLVATDGGNRSLKLAMTCGVDRGKGLKAWSSGDDERTNELLDQLMTHRVSRWMDCQLRN
ncbi:hypothetical protein HAX54_044114, partial [Datura stramonium]|nr:hypothetical protein [Datura stramonium]